MNLKLYSFKNQVEAKVIRNNKLVPLEEIKRGSKGIVYARISQFILRENKISITMEVMEVLITEDPGNNHKRSFGTGVEANPSSATSSSPPPPPYKKMKLDFTRADVNGQWMIIACVCVCFETVKWIK